MPIQTSNISALKKELNQLPKEVVIEHCMRLAKYKKENKEMLHYLLFEAIDEQAYIKEIKNEIESELKSINSQSLYYTKKTIRKVLKLVTKYIKHSGIKTTQIELLIHFCKTLKMNKVPIKNSKVLRNLYERQLININKALSSVHEDLRLDYEEDIETIKL